MSGKDQGPGRPGGTAFAPLQIVRAYWEGLRPARGLPRRSDIDPLGMDQVLEHVFLLERIAPGHARVRLAGHHLAEILGMEVRGMPLTALINPAGRNELPPVLEQVFSGPAILDLALVAEHEFGRPALEARMQLLPVLGDEGRCDRALGCLVSLGRIGRGPRRFTIQRHVLQALDVDLDPPLPPMSPRRQFSPGMAESAPAFVPATAAPPPVQTSTPTPAKGRPHLRLIKFDD